MGYGGQIRRVRLGKNAIPGHESEQIVIVPLLECDDAAEGDVPAGGNRGLGESARSGEAVKDPDHADGACFRHHRTSVVFRIAGVNDHGTSELAGERHLLGKCAPLLEARGVVIVVVETALSDRYCSSSHKIRQPGNVAGRVEARSIVRVYARGVGDVAGIARGKSSCVTRGGEDIPLAAARADADDRPGTGEARPLDYRVAVAGERRVGEVRVAVDEVWNAVVLRGHLRSIQRSTGLAT